MPKFWQARMRYNCILQTRRYAQQEVPPGNFFLGTPVQQNFGSSFQSEKCCSPNSLTKKGRLETVTPKGKIELKVHLDQIYDFGGKLLGRCGAHTYAASSMRTLCTTSLSDNLNCLVQMPTKPAIFYKLKNTLNNTICNCILYSTFPNRGSWQNHGGSPSGIMTLAPRHSTLERNI